MFASIVFIIYFLLWFLILLTSNFVNWLIFIVMFFLSIFVCLSVERLSHVYNLNIFYVSRFIGHIQFCEHALSQKCMYFMTCKNEINFSMKYLFTVYSFHLTLWFIWLIIDIKMQEFSNYISNVIVKVLDIFQPYRYDFLFIYTSIIHCSFVIYM